MEKALILVMDYVKLQENLRNTLKESFKHFEHAQVCCHAKEKIVLRPCTFCCGWIGCGPMYSAAFFQQVIVPSSRQSRNTLSPFHTLHSQLETQWWIYRRFPFVTQFKLPHSSLHSTWNQSCVQSWVRAHRALLLNNLQVHYIRFYLRCNHFTECLYYLKMVPKPNKCTASPALSVFGSSSSSLYQT